MIVENNTVKNDNKKELKQYMVKNDVCLKYKKVMVQSRQN